MSGDTTAEITPSSQDTSSSSAEGAKIIAETVPLKVNPDTPPPDTMHDHASDAQQIADVRTEVAAQAANPTPSVDTEIHEPNMLEHPDSPAPLEAKVADTFVTKALRALSGFKRGGKR